MRRAFHSALAASAEESAVQSRAVSGAPVSPGRKIGLIFLLLLTSSVATRAATVLKDNLHEQADLTIGQATSGSRNYAAKQAKCPYLVRHTQIVSATS